MFKKYTGVPPVRYHLELKLLKAKEMLLLSDRIIKEYLQCKILEFVYSGPFKDKLVFLGATKPGKLRNSCSIRRKQ